MKISKYLGLLTLIASTACLASPPFSGTAYINANLITKTDPSTFESTTYQGQASRVVYDRRAESFITLSNAYVFKAKYKNGKVIEVIVNPEFGSSTEAKKYADKYAFYIGQFPVSINEKIAGIEVNRGNYALGGNSGTRAITIHTGRADEHEASGTIEETLFHEAVHTSFEDSHASAPGWLAAQKADNEFISTYARDFPTREDLSETVLLAIAASKFKSRLSTDQYNAITRAIPNRIKYLDGLNLNYAPLLPENRAAMTSPAPNSVLGSQTITFTWSKPAGAQAFDLLLGTQGPGSTDLRSSKPITTASLVVSTLPANGQTIYARLWTSSPDSGWQYTDYTYTAKKISGCRTPKNVQVVDSSSTSARIAWASGNAPTHYVYYHQATKPWILVADNLASTSLTLSALSPRTTYEVDVYSKCPTQSLVGKRLTFTTP